MKKRLLDFKQTKPMLDRIRDAVLSLGLPEDNTNKIFEFVTRTKNSLGDDNELKKFIQKLVEMGFIDE